LGACVAGSMPQLRGYLCPNAEPRSLPVLHPTPSAALLPCSHSRSPSQLSGHGDEIDDIWGRRGLALLLDMSFYDNAICPVNFRCTNAEINVTLMRVRCGEREREGAGRRTRGALKARWNGDDAMLACALEKRVDRCCLSMGNGQPLTFGRRGVNLCPITKY
jgi:hypothetical protein